MHDSNPSVEHTGENVSETEEVRAALDNLIQMLSREIAHRIYEEQRNQGECRRDR